MSAIEIAGPNRALAGRGSHGSLIEHAERRQGSAHYG